MPLPSHPHLAAASATAPGGPLRLRRLLWLGALVGASVHLGLFAYDLLGGSGVEYMGVEDDRVIDIVMDLFRDRLVLQQIELAAIAAGLGAGIGVLVSLWIGLLFAALGRRLRLLLHTPLTLFGVLLAHAAFLQAVIAQRPAAYAAPLLQRGGPEALLAGAAVDLLPPWLPSALGWAYLASGLCLVSVLALRRAGPASPRPRRRLLPIASAAAALALLALVFWPGRPRLRPRSAGPPNVILLAVDSLRADLIEDDPLAPTTPNLNRLARRGAWLRRTFVPLPRTFPAWVSLLTGRYPHNHGVRHMFPPVSPPPDIGRVLPGLLSRWGYRTGVVSDFAGDIFGRLDFGYQHVDVPPFTLLSNARLGGLKAHPHLLPYLVELFGGAGFPEVHAFERLLDPERLSDRALDWIANGEGGDPFFLTVFYSDGHFPYASASPWWRRFTDPDYRGRSRFFKETFGATPGGPEREAEVRHLRGLYRGAIASSDAAIGRLLDTLEAAGVLENTLVIATADHGEHLYERGLGVGHGEHLYGSASLMVPLILAGPGVPGPGVEISEPVRTVDLLPTLFHLLGRTAPPGLDGVDLLPLLGGEPLSEPLPIFAETGLLFLSPETDRLEGRQMVFAERFDAFRYDPETWEIELDPAYERTFLVAKHRTIRRGDRKLHYIPTRDGVRWELYDPLRDPGEEHDLAAAEPGRLATLRSELMAWMLEDIAMVQVGDWVVPWDDGRLQGLEIPWVPSTWSPPAGASEPALPVAAPRSDLGPSAPLRSISLRLVEHLEGARIRPELISPPPALRCLKDRQHSPNPYSPLPSMLRPQHQRLTFAGGGRGRVEQRDGLLFGLPRSFRFVLDRLPPEPRLELVYRPVACQGRTGALRMTVELRAPGRSEPLHRSEPLLRKAVELEPRVDMAAPPWRPITIPLPEVQGPVALEISFSDPGRRGPTGGAVGSRGRKGRPALALGEPVITGREGPEREAQDRNVLLIVVDALRGDVIGPDRRIPRSVTPELDALAARGALFTRAFSVADQTRPSTLALLQSQTPSGGRFHSPNWPIEASRKERYYGADPPLLSRILGARGWRVATIGHNHFLWDAYTIGLDHGFDQVVDERRRVADTPRIAAQAADFIRRHRDDRWFLMMNVVAPHAPYVPPEPFRSKIGALYPRVDPAGLSRLYLGEVAFADAAVGEVLRALDAEGLRDRTLVVVTSDHGEVLWSHHACRSAHFKQICYASHGLTLYEEEVHVPLLLALPGEILPGHVARNLVSQLDLAPTVLDLLGLPAHPRHAGRSLRAELRGAPAEDEPIYAEARSASSLRLGSLKLIVHGPEDDVWTRARTGGTASHPRLELFDLNADDRETRNLALRRDPRALRLHVALRRLRAELAARADPAAPPEAPPSIRTAEGDAGGPDLPPLPATPLPPPHFVANQVELHAESGRSVLEGSIRVPDGDLRCGEVQGEAACTAAPGGGLRVRLVAGEAPARVGFETAPWEARLDMDLSLDGRPLPPDRLHLGAYGLRLLAPGEALDTPGHLLRAAALHPPRLPARGEPGLYLWRAPPALEASPEIGPGRGEASAPPGRRPGPDLDPQMLRVLKELGYAR